MRVLMIHNDYLQIGGEYFSVRAETAALRSVGVDVELLAVGNEEFGASSSLRLNAAKSLILSDGRGKVEDAIREFQPDIVHAQNLFPRLGGGAIDVIGKAGIPWVRTLRNYRLSCLSANHRRDGQACFDCANAASAFSGVQHGCYRGSKAASLGALLYGVSENFHSARHGPSAYLVLSQAMLRRLQHRVGDVPVYIRPNIVSPPIVEMATPENRKGSVYIGRLSEEKGIDVVLKVAAMNPDVSFQIVGDGPLRGVVEEEAAARSNVEYVGEISNQQCVSLMGSARSVIIPSQWEEPFGRVAAEALSVGALPIVPPFGGLPEIVDEIQFRLVAGSNTPSDYSEIVRSIESLTPNEFFHYSRAAYYIWSTRYSPAAGGVALANIYKEVTENWSR